MAHRTPTSNTDRTQPLSVPVSDGDGAPIRSAAEEGAHADPTPAASPSASAEDLPRDGDRAGAGRPNQPRDGDGRFLSPAPIRRIPAELFAAEAEAILGMSLIEAEVLRPPSAALAHALFDAEQEVWRTNIALRTERVRAAAVGFVDGVRHTRGEAP